MGFQVALVIKNLPVNVGDTRDVGSIPGSGRSPEVRSGNLLQYSCLKNSRQKSLTGYSPWGHKESDMTEHTHIDTHKVTNIEVAFVRIL